MKYVAYRSIVVVVLALADISYISYHIYSCGNEKPRIGWAAHTAGALSGQFTFESSFFHRFFDCMSGFRFFPRVTSLQGNFQMDQNSAHTLRDDPSYPLCPCDHIQCSEISSSPKRTFLTLSNLTIIY